MEDLCAAHGGWCCGGEWTDYIAAYRTDDRRSVDLRLCEDGEEQDRGDGDGEPHGTRYAYERRDRWRHCVGCSDVPVPSVQACARGPGGLAGEHRGLAAG